MYELAQHDSMGKTYSKTIAKKLCKTLKGSRYGRSGAEITVHRQSKRRVRSHQLCPRKWRMQRCPETTCPAINKWRENLQDLWKQIFRGILFDLEYIIYWSLNGNWPILSPSKLYENIGLTGLKVGSPMWCFPMLYPHFNGKIMINIDTPVL